ncbi:MAG: hypothetical protein K5694_02850 [Bacilli bacterium]|nr:hypothetical protein [Bacilli bacterium]
MAIWGLGPVEAFPAVYRAPSLLAPIGYEFPTVSGLPCINEDADKFVFPFFGFTG